MDVDGGDGVCSHLGLDWNPFLCSLGVGQDIECLDMGCDGLYDSSQVQVQLRLY